MRNLMYSTLLVSLFATSALAQDSAYPEGQSVGDYRFHVYVACSLVFVAIVVFLVMSHKKGAKLDDELAHVEKRLSELEG